MPVGRVIAIRGKTCDVAFEGRLYVSMLRGKLKRERGSAMKLVTTGDFVEFTPQPDGEGSIEKVLERRTVLARSDPHFTHKRQVIVANVDVVAAVHSIRDPDLDLTNIDRCTVLAAAAGIASAVVFNKCDLGEAPAEAYRKLGLPTFVTSAATGAGIAELAAFIKGKTVALLGPSGAGKSSLLNALAPELKLTTGMVSYHSGEGTHTTSWVEFYEVAGGLVADTPGLEFFTFWDITRGNLRDHFPEMAERGLRCAYTNCVHLTEPRCKVKAALEAGDIAPTRYDSYRRLYETLPA